MELVNQEEWRDVVGYEGLYRVSSLGRLASCDITYSDARGNRRTFKGRILKISIPKGKRCNYPYTTLHRHGLQVRERIHRLVAKAFIPNPDSLPQVNHKDGDKTNNRVENLEWCTARDNLLHSFRTGLHPNEDFEQNADKRPVIVTSPSGETFRFPSVGDAAAFMGYKYASHFSRDLHKRNGLCKGGYIAKLEKP